MLATRRQVSISMTVRLGLMLVFVSAVTSHSSPIRLPTALIAPEERGEYVARDAHTQEELWRTRWVIERANNGRDMVYRVREDGAGRRGRPEPTRWTVTMEVDLAQGSEAFSAVREIRDVSDRPLETMRRALSYKARTGTVTIVDHTKNAESSESFTVEETSIPVELLPMQLRALSDAPERRMRFHLLTREGKSVPMAARIVGQETISTPAGDFAAYKTELSVTGVRGLLGQLVLPAMYMWHRVDPPHAWLRYRGLDGGIGSREVVMELVRFEMDGKQSALMRALTRRWSRQASRLARRPD
jgi:hypothetical protein